MSDETYVEGSEDSVDVVVIDDDASTLMAVDAILRGFNVITFQDPGMALQHIGNTPPALTIVDINIPNASGFEVCKRLRENPKTEKIPILMFTSDPSQENVKKAVEIGVDGFLAKPFIPQDMRQKVRQMIQKGGG